MKSGLPRITPNHRVLHTFLTSAPNGIHASIRYGFPGAFERMASSTDVHFCRTLPVFRLVLASRYIW
jgi:hypothetical protein